MVQCSKCNEEKPDEEYPTRKGKRNGSICKKCLRSYHRKHYQENKEYYIEKSARHSKRYNQRNREYVQGVKDNQKCADCGKRYPHYVLDFDHLMDKKENIADMVTHGVSLKKLKTEIAKCEIVCSNCHRIRTWQRKPV